MGALHHTLRLAAVALIGATIASPCAALTVTLSPAADTYVRQIVNANEGTADFLRINANPNRALVRFDQAPIAAAAVGMVLLSASLDLYVESASSWGSGREVDVHRLTTAWTETGATWNCPIDSDTGNNQPDCAVQWNGGSIVASPTATLVQTDSLIARYVSFDVTADVAAFLSGTPNNGWLVKKQSEGDTGVAVYTSREGAAAAQRPRLVLNLAVPTATSTRTRTATTTPTVAPGVTVTPQATATPESGCGAIPMGGCKQPIREKKSLLLLKSKGGTGDRLVWKWGSGEATAAAEFGDPTAVTTYALCLYGETAGQPALSLSALLPPSQAWSATAKGFKFSDPAATNGITGILLKEGADGKAKIIVKGAGANLDLPTLPLAQDQHVIVQLSHADAPQTCWEARYGAPAKNDDRHFKDKGDPPGPASTPTPAAPTNTPGGSGTATPTATAIPTPGSGVCGNGFLEPGETCGNCPGDCTIGACTATATMVTFQVHFEGALGTSPITATTLLGYRSDHVSIPGSGTATSVRQRVTFPTPLPNSTAINDLDYAIRVVVGRTAGLPNGLLYAVKFDQCQGAPAVTAADFGCAVEACAGAGGPIVGCTCTVAGP